MKNCLVILFVIGNYFSFGQSVVRNFTMTSLDNAEVSLETYSRYEGIVILFTGHACPFDGYYRDRIRSLVQNYGTKVQFLLVNSYLEPEESIEKMKVAYTALGLPVPYLADKTQAALQALGAKKSPEAFVLKTVPGGYSIWYSGALDDSPQSAAAVTTNFLKTAIDNLLSGKDAMPAQRSVGCTIRKK